MYGAKVPLIFLKQRVINHHDRTQRGNRGAVCGRRSVDKGGPDHGQLAFGNVNAAGRRGGRGGKVSAET